MAKKPQYPAFVQVFARQKICASDQLVPIAYGTPEHLSLHPFGKMPLLTHGEVTVFETAAIISYLDRNFPGHRLISDDPMEQVRTLTAITVAVDYAYQPVVFTGKPDGVIEQDTMSAALRVFDWMQDCLNCQPFMVGPDISAADVLFAPMLDHHIKEQGDEHVFIRPVPSSSSCLPSIFV